MEREITVNFDCTSVELMLEKANLLVELLREVQQIIDSLSGANRSET